MLRSWLACLLFPEIKRGATMLFLEPGTLPPHQTLIERMETIIRAIEISHVTTHYDTCLVIREADGSLGVYSIPDRPSGGGVTSIRDKVIGDALKIATKVA